MIKIFLARFLMALVLVVVTYNPTPFSMLNYLTGPSDFTPSNMAIKGIVLLLLGMAWWVFVKTAIHSLRGMAVVVMILLVLGAYVAAIRAGELGYAFGTDALIWLALVLGAFFLALGATASHIKLRWAGVRNVDDVEQ